MNYADKPVYLVITTYFPTPESWRCAFVYDQAVAIQRTGRYEVIVVNVNYPRDYEYQGIRVVGVKSVNRGTAFCPVLFDLLNNRRFDAALRRNGIDLQRVSVAHSHLVTTAQYALHVKKANRNVKTIV